MLQLTLDPLLGELLVLSVPPLQSFVDSDYATDGTRRSTMAGMMMLNGGPLSWFSNFGKTVATSTLQLFLDKQIQFKYCPTDLQLADMLTKPLDSIKFCSFRITNF